MGAMSKIRNPQEKKAKSLKLDRRNCYGESPHASRKNIARGKKRQHQQERRAARSELPAFIRSSFSDEAEQVEGRIRARTRLKRLAGFRKHPDRPLAEALARKARGHGRKPADSQ